MTGPGKLGDEKTDTGVMDIASGDVRGYSVVLRTTRYGRWMLQDAVFRRHVDAARYIDALAARTEWADIIREWDVIAVGHPPNAHWDNEHGLVVIQRAD